MSSHKKSGGGCFMRPFEANNFVVFVMDYMQIVIMNHIMLNIIVGKSINQIFID